MIPYDYLNIYNGSRSTSGTVENDLSTRYFERCLYQRLTSTISISAPEVWDSVYLHNTLFRNGYIAVIPTEKYGVIPQLCTLSGYGIFLQPTRVIVAQPLVSFEGEIGEDCEIIKLTPDFRGVCDIVEHYARRLSTAWASVDVALVNSRLSLLSFAKNKSAAETLKYVAERISAGEPMIVVDKAIKSDDMSDRADPIFTVSHDVKNNYIVTQLLEDIQTIITMFDREIGIPSVSEKRERMLTDEIGMQNADSTARLKTWSRCLTESIGRVNKMFPELGLTYKTVLEGLENG